MNSLALQLVEPPKVKAVHKKALEQSGIRKGDRVLVNIGTAKKPDFRVGTVLRRRNGKTGLLIKLDRGDSVQIGVTESLSGVIAKLPSAVGSSAEAIEWDSVHALLREAPWVSQSMQTALENDKTGAKTGAIRLTVIDPTGKPPKVVKPQNQLKASKQDLLDARLRRGSRVIVNHGQFKANSTDLRVGTVIRLDKKEGRVKVGPDVRVVGSSYKRRYPVKWWDVDNSGSGLLGLVRSSLAKRKYTSRISPVDLDDWIDVDAWFADDLSDPGKDGLTLREFQQIGRDSRPREEELQVERVKPRKIIPKGKKPAFLDFGGASSLHKEEIQVARELVNLGIEEKSIDVTYETNDVDFSLRFISRRNEKYAVSKSSLDNLWYVEREVGGLMKADDSLDACTVEDLIIALRSLLG